MGPHAQQPLNSRETGGEALAKEESFGIEPLGQKVSMGTAGMFQPQGIAGIQGKHVSCAWEGKPGLGEFSESLATVAGWISFPGIIPLLANPPQLCGTTCVVAPELVRAIFSSWRSLSQVIVVVKAIPTE